MSLVKRKKKSREVAIGHASEMGTKTMEEFLERSRREEKQEPNQNSTMVETNREQEAICASNRFEHAYEADHVGTTTNAREKVESLAEETTRFNNCFGRRPIYLGW